MRNNARQTRENRTITVDFPHEATSFPLRADGNTFGALGMAFSLALGFQLTHQATGGGGGCLTHHAHDIRVRLQGVPRWRRQGTTGRAVCTDLPPLVLR
jgi:hypothetical protein